MVLCFLLCIMFDDCEVVGCVLCIFVGDKDLLVDVGGVYCVICNFDVIVGVCYL